MGMKRKKCQWRWGSRIEGERREWAGHNGSREQKKWKENKAIALTGKESCTALPKGSVQKAMEGAGAA